MKHKENLKHFELCNCWRDDYSMCYVNASLERTVQGWLFVSLGKLLQSVKVLVVKVVVLVAVVVVEVVVVVVMVVIEVAAVEVA